MLTGLAPSVVHGRSEESGCVDGGRDQVDSLVVVFGHEIGPRAGFLEPLACYSHSLDMVTGREGCWFIICSEQTAFPAPDPGGGPQVPFG